MWLVVFIAFQLFILVLIGTSFLVTLGSHAEASLEERLAAYVLAGIALAICLALTQYRLRPTGDPTLDRGITLDQLLANSILALSAGEAATLVGFAVVGMKSFSDFAIIPLANLAVNLVFVLRAGLASWSWMESRGDL